MSGRFSLGDAEGNLVKFPDPSGGIADAAGDFDGLLWRHGRGLLTVGQLTPTTTSSSRASRRPRRISHASTLAARCRPCGARGTRRPGRRSDAGRSLGVHGVRV
jgi:hypothetical protein